MTAEARGSVSIGLVQMACSANPEANLDRAALGVVEAAARGAQMVCLPELFRSHYFCQTEDVARFDLAEPIPGDTTDRLAEIAREKQVVLVVPVFERRAAGVYHNSAVVIDADGTLLGAYRKMHIPDDPAFYEKFYFTPGDLGFRSFETRYGRVGVVICWDQWFPEAARLTALCGPTIIFCPTAIGWLEDEKADQGSIQHDAWETVQRGHAVANGIYWAAVNRVGVEGGCEFWGRSFVADPLGQLVARAGGGEEILVVECSFDRVEAVRRIWPFFRDRRIDAFAGLSRRFLDENA